MKNSDYNFCNKIVQIPLNYREEKPRTRKIINLRKRILENIGLKEDTF
jgi:hypothetical protein